MKKYLLVVCGGTFDRLHKGHRDFLDFVLGLGEKVVIGLTSDRYVEANKKGRGIESYEVRKHNLEQYLETIGKKDVVEIISIDDPFGPTITDEYNFDAIAVTEETLSGGKEINLIRQKRGLFPLPLEVFKMTKEAHGAPVSSTSVRHAIFKLPVSLRPLLQEPWGEILDKVPENLDAKKVITVGDVTTKMFLDAGIHPKLSIIDLKIERDHKVKNIQELGFLGNENIIKVRNSASTITQELVSIIQKNIQDEIDSLIIVEGEEDLAVLPVLIHAPIGFLVFYGQPGQGMVKVDITAETKKRASELIGKFEKT